jgi:carboxypeptidase C (cathepsin A)
MHMYIYYSIKLLCLHCVYNDHYSPELVCMEKERAQDQVHELAEGAFSQHESSWREQFLHACISEQSTKEQGDSTIVIISFYIIEHRTTVRFSSHILSPSHDHRNVIVHVLTDIAQKASSDNADSSKTNTHVVHVLVRFRIRHLPRHDDHFVPTRNVRDTRDLFQVLQKRCSCQLDSFLDESRISDAELVDHCASDVLSGSRDKLGDEDVVAVLVSVSCFTSLFCKERLTIRSSRSSHQ